MSPQDFNHIEQALSLVLPAAYRDAMTAYPFPGDSPAAELWVLNQVEPLLQLNRTYRLGRHSSWAAHLFVVGSDGGEEAYVLDTSVDPAPVRVFELETGKFRPYASDFHEFIRLQAQALAEVEADERVLADRSRNKRWWQFWIRPQ
jgi:hypothetical protein